ncbi:MAG: DUF4390 domain-containing protein [Betaproteobacteria bacterium]|nr:DUF4390 domain-containing protein [Betaproteobacteria bacterium]
MPSMMVSFTPCCARRDSTLRGWVGLLLAFWLTVAGSAQASDKSAVSQAAIRATPQGYVLDGDVNIVLNSTLEDALSRGINLYFLLELELSRPRNWWFDEDIADPVRKMRIYYHLLLRRYVVETGYTTRTAATLSEALAMLGRVDAWQVLERGALKTGQRYDARLRLRLDTSQLPKPLSIGAVGGDRWELVTPWYDWSFDAPVVPVPPAPLP